MDLTELQALVAQGESEHLAFKKTTGELHGGMETLCALLNGSGGKVLFGVTNSGRIVGQDVSDATLQLCRSDKLTRLRSAKLSHYLERRSGFLFQVVGLRYVEQRRCGDLAGRPG